MWDAALLTHLFAFVAVTSLVLWLGPWLIPNRLSSRRLEELRETSAEADGPRAGRTITPGYLVRTSLRNLGAKLLPNRQSERTQLQSRLMHAGLYSPAALPTYLATKLLLMIVPPVVGG